MSFEPESDINDTRNTKFEGERRFWPEKIPLVISSCFGIGKIPIAPGTVASLAAIPLYLLLSSGSWWWMPSVIAALLIVGTWASHKAEHILMQRDPQSVVIDEVVGYLFCMIFLAPDPWKIVVGFALFRCLDIIKPPPIRWADRNLHGGMGIMADDVIAGLATNAILRIIPWG